MGNEKDDAEEDDNGEDADGGDEAAEGKRSAVRLEEEQDDVGMSEAPAVATWLGKSRGVLQCRKWNLRGCGLRALESWRRLCSTASRQASVSSRAGGGAEISRLATCDATKWNRRGSKHGERDGNEEDCV